MKTTGYRLVRLKNGLHSVHANAYGETFHPVIGPAAEAEALHVNQLHLIRRATEAEGELVVWDVGLGAAANAIAVLNAVRGCASALRLVSFDLTMAPLQFAIDQAESLSYLIPYRHLLESLVSRPGAPLQFDNGRSRVTWTVVLDDFPSLLERGQISEVDARLWRNPSPHAILYDPFSPASNPSMWTLPLFRRLHRCLEPARPCAMASYSRSTMLRVTLLLAGFYVGVGRATGEKEETTVAANSMALIETPLPRDWLGKVRRSSSAEPLHEAQYRQQRLATGWWPQLEAHPQFNL